MNTNRPVPSPQAVLNGLKRRRQLIVAEQEQNERLQAKLDLKKAQVDQALSIIDRDIARIEGFTGGVQ